jgi:tetratricopeptide (TPR) repeat protein
VSRYRLALVPVLCLLATAGAVEIGRRNRKALVVAAVAALVTIPWGLESTRDLWRAQALANEAHRWAKVGAAEGSEAALVTAEKLYRESLVRDAAGPAPWFGLASLLVERGAREEAAQILAEGAQATARNHDLNKALLALLLEDGHRPEALELTGTILGTRPRDADTLHNRTILLSEAGRADEAVQTARDLVAAHPADARGYIDLGVILARAGRREEAHAVFAEGLRAVPDDPRLQRNLDLLSH